MDQFVVLLGIEGYVLWIDFCSFEVVEVLFDLGDWWFVIVDSGASYMFVVFGYNQRRVECW